MAATKDRYQNPTIGDTVQLKLFVYNSNAPGNVDYIDHIDIFTEGEECHNRCGNKLDPGDPQRRLVQTFPGTAAVQNAVGEYELDVLLENPLYTIGRYTDVWFVKFLDTDYLTEMANLFRVYPQLWYTSPIPIVHDFEFFFQPNRMRYGENKWIEIEVVPNVPRATDLARYYENLVISSDLNISIELACGPCLPTEEDLRLVVDCQPTQFRDKNRAYYRIDTTTLECSIYNIWFTLNFGGNTYISPKNQFQIY